MIKLYSLDEHGDFDFVRMMVQKQIMERYYNHRVNLHYFKVGDLVLLKITHNTRKVNAQKLGLNWEGPYWFLGITGIGSYHLKNHDGVKFPSN